MKKILNAVPVLALAFIFSASSAFAYENNNHNEHSKPSLIEVKNENNASIKNGILSLSNTGLNSIEEHEHENNNTPAVRSSRNNHHSSSKSEIKTGEAYAEAEVQNLANDNKIVVKAPKSGTTKIYNRNGADVENHVASIANSGLNAIHGSGEINTGSANSFSKSFTVVNSNVIKIK